MSIDVQENTLHTWKEFLTRQKFKGEFPDDIYVWLTCILALQAAVHGNFGVGSVLIDKNGDVISSGHNEVFEPYFRSDRHAEMVVISKFEDKYRNIADTGNLRLYASLEPCPMCLARIITSGVGSVLYAAPDEDGGMVHNVRKLPLVWTGLAERQIFGQARCTQALVDAASHIFKYTATQLDDKLKQRR